MIRRLSLAFTAGAVGGVCSGLVAWKLGEAGIMASMGVFLAPELTIEWFCPRVVWGGIWGLLFALPLFRGSIFVRGFLFSLVPTAAELFVIFPLFVDRGVMGFSLGTLTPLFVFFFNLVWGFSGAFWARLTR